MQLRHLQEGVGESKAEAAEVGRENKGFLPRSQWVPMSHTTDIASHTRTAKRPAGFANDLTSDLV